VVIIIIFFFELEFFRSGIGEWRLIALAGFIRQN